MKNRTIAIILALFLGGFGAHKFYLEKPVQGVLYAIFFWTLIPGFIAIIDLIIMLVMSQEKWEAKYKI